MYCQPSHTSGRDLVVAGTVCTVLLAVALFVPMIAGDPTALDPYLLRITIAAVLATVVLRLVGKKQLWIPGALATVIIGSATFWLWLMDALPSLHPAVLHHPNVDFTLGILGQCIATGGGLLLLGRIAPASRTWCSRLRRLSLPVLIAGAGSIVLFTVITFLLPAALLGRYAIIPGALGTMPAVLLVGDALQGMVQEIQFRGALLSWLEGIVRPWQANLIQACFFGLAHIAIVFYAGPGVPLIPLAILLGYGAGWLTQKTGSLWPALILHAFIDIWVSLVIVPGLYGMG